MAITDERTPKLNLPLPVKTNALKDDVERLRGAFSTIDNALGDASVVASEAEMLELNVEPGSKVIRSDSGKSYVLTENPASTLANWKEMLNDALVTLAQPDGIYKSGWERNPLTKAITKAGERFDATPISIWEFADYVTDKPSSDPNTWDWAPAITAGIIATAQQTEMPLGSATRYSSGYLDFPPGKYIVRSQVKVDFSSMMYVTGKPVVRIRMNGAYISTALDRVYTIWILGCFVDIDGLNFIREDDTIKAYYLKLGSEVTSNTTSVMGRISNLRCYSPTKGLTFGQAYDIIFDGMYMTGFTAVDDNDTSNPATAIHFLSHSGDNCNNILFNRVHLETSYTANYVAIKADDNQNTNQPHHNIKFNAGHVETHFRGAKWFDLGLSNQINFDTVVFTDNGTNTVSPASYTLGMLATYVQRFDGCTFQTNNLSTVAYDPLVHKSMLKFYPGNATSREFNTCYFSTAFINSPGANNFNAAIDATNTTNGNNSYRPNNCSLNNFSRRVSGGNIYSDLASSNRKYLVGVDSADSALKWTFNNTDMSYNGGTVVMSLSQSGLLTASGGLSTNGNVAAGSYLHAGINNTTAGNRDVSFYPYGNNNQSARILADTGGGLSIINNGADINYVANSGASNHIFTGTVRPKVTATYNLGSSAITFNAGYFTSWTIGTASILPATDNSVDMGSPTLRVKRSYVVSRYYTATVFDSAGSGSPEGAITASVGSTYRRTDGGANSTFYVKEAGTGNTGWVAK